MRLYKTELGQTAFKERSSLFSARQRSTFILFDGQRTVDQVLAATLGMGMGMADVEHLLAIGFLARHPGEQPDYTKTVPLQVAVPSANAAPSPAPAAATERPAAPPRTDQQRYFDAKPIATQLTATLGLRGFMLNLAVEGAAGYPELLKLLPRIQDALGAKACRKLERALLD